MQQSDRCREKPIATDESAIRTALSAQLCNRFGDESQRIIHELGLLQGGSRIDVAVVNSKLHGYEIKSDRDSLTRLPSQIRAYSRVLDYLTVVASSRHFPAIESVAPSWCGLEQVTADGRDLVIVKKRLAKPNMASDPRSVLQLLWRREALATLERLGVARDLKNEPRRVLWERLATILTPEEITRVVCDSLRERKGWRVHQGGPSSLTTVVK